MKIEDSLIHRLFYPQVPLILSAQSGERVSAMPVVSYASISDKPPLIAVACSPLGYTCKLTLKARAFSLSILDRTQSNALARLATLSGAKVKDKLKESGLSHVNGQILSVPVIERSIATLECKLRESSRHGDHLLLVGMVKAAYASGAFTEFWDFGRYRPVLYTGWREGLTMYPES